MGNLHIEVDRRQPPSRLEALKDLGLDAEYVHLDSGDYAFTAREKRVGIEEKSYETKHGLMNDISTGRFFEQQEKLARSYDIAVLLTTGFRRQKDDDTLTIGSSPGTDTNWHFMSVDQALFKVQLMGVLITDCPRFMLVPKRIKLIREYAEQGLVLSHRSRPDVFTFDPLYTQAIHCLSAIPEIGPQRAVQLLEKFGSVQNFVLQARLPGTTMFGPKIDNQIREFLMRAFGGAEARV